METRLIYDFFLSPIGGLFLTFAGKKLTAITTKKPEGIRPGSAPDSFKIELSAYFSGNLRAFNQEIVFLDGTEFEKSVWRAAREVPYGETRTYKWLSERVGKPGAYRAVGQALSKNPVPIVIPCHRIIESDGNIGGYSEGVEIKRRLLEMEYYYSLKEGHTI